MSLLNDVDSEEYFNENDNNDETQFSDNKYNDDEYDDYEADDDDEYYNSEKFNNDTKATGNYSKRQGQINQEVGPKDTNKLDDYAEQIKELELIRKQLKDKEDKLSRRLQNKNKIISGLLEDLNKKPDLKFGRKRKNSFGYEALPIGTFMKNELAKVYEPLNGFGLRKSKPRRRSNKTKARKLRTKKLKLSKTKRIKRSISNQMLFKFYNPNGTLMTVGDAIKELKTNNIFRAEILVILRSCKYKNFTWIFDVEPGFNNLFALIIKKKATSVPLNKNVGKSSEVYHKLFKDIATKIDKNTKYVNDWKIYKRV